MTQGDFRRLAVLALTLLLFMAATQHTPRELAIPLGFLVGIGAREVADRVERWTQGRR